MRACHPRHRCQATSGNTGFSSAALWLLSLLHVLALPGRFGEEPVSIDRYLLFKQFKQDRNLKWPILIGVTLPFVYMWRAVLTDEESFKHDIFLQSNPTENVTQFVQGHYTADCSDLIQQTYTLNMFI